MRRSAYARETSRFDPRPSHVCLSESGELAEAEMRPLRHRGNIDNFERNNVKPLGVVMQTTAQGEATGGGGRPYLVRKPTYREVQSDH